MKKRRFMVFLLLLSVLFALPIVAQTSSEDEAKYGGELVQLMSDEPNTLNIQVSSRDVSERIVAQVMEPLVTVDNNLEVTGLLAKAWEKSEDGLTWTFKLNEGIYFHNGEPFNAEAVAFTFSEKQYFRDGNVYASSLSVVKDVKAIDEYTVEFTLKERYPLLAEFLCRTGQVIFPPEATTKYGDEFGIEVLIGTGPYKLEAWKRGEEIILTRYEDYNHGPAFLRKGPAYIEKKVFRIIPESTTRLAELITGSADLEFDVDPRQIVALQEADNVTTVISPFYGMQFVTFNCDKPILNDPKVRVAINHAINKESILKVAWNDIGFIAHSHVVEAMLGYDTKVAESLPDYEYNPEKAKELLDQAGWVDSDGDGVREKDGKELRLNLMTYTDNDPFVLASQIIKPQLNEIGIKVDLRLHEAGALYDLIRDGEHDMVITQHNWPFAPVSLKWYYHSSDIPFPNWSNYADPELDELIEKSANAYTGEERKEALSKAQQLAQEIATHVYLIEITSRMAASDRVGGIEQLNQHPWWDGLTQALVLYLK